MTAWEPQGSPFGTSASPMAGAAGIAPAPSPAGLADVLDRILDKGLVVAGDIRVDLVGVELLTIKIRLLLASADRAAELGMDWWRTDPYFSSKALALEEENRALRQRLDRLEDALETSSEEEEDEDEYAD